MFINLSQVRTTIQINLFSIVYDENHKFIFLHYAPIILINIVIFLNTCHSNLKPKILKFKNSIRIVFFLLISYLKLCIFMFIFVLIFIKNEFIE